jgi:hypothetical protein
MKVLPQSHTFLPAEEAVSMLEETSTVLADSQLKTDTFSVTVFGFTDFAVGIVGWNRVYAAFGEGESFGHSGLL